MSRLPSLFLSHGSPMLVLEDCPARRFLAGLGAALPRPQAIVVVSAHHDARRVLVTAAPQPPTVHDFGGFPPALYRLAYPAPGSPELAERLVARLGAAGFDAQADPQGGLDHGCWVPLLLAYPEADIPVVQLSIDMARDARWHLGLGRALAGLDGEGVLLVGSGSVTHNLRELFADRRPLDAPPLPWVHDFAEWLAARLAAGAVDDVLAFERAALHGRRAHPTPDHILPLFVVLGAAGAPPAARRLHASTAYGHLAMDAYAFGGDVQP